MRMTATAELRREYHRKPIPSIFHRKTAASFFVPPPWDQYSDHGFKWDNKTTISLSGRWSPTREQLQSLEEMYRRGIRTPTSEEIQQIVLKLRRFGRIEGKNVFYWFQNHKAREKQKKRRIQEQLNKFGLGTHSSSSSYTSSDIITPLKLQQEKMMQTTAAERSSPFALSLEDFSADKVTEQEEAGNRHKYKLFADGESWGDTRTLELFPVKTRNGVEVDRDGDDGVRRIEASEPENRFFEFIPVREG